MNHTNINGILDMIIVNLSNGSISVEEINDDTNLVLDIGFDSLSMIQCIVEIENAFQIEFDDEDIGGDKMQEYSTLLSLITDKLGDRINDYK